MAEIILTMAGGERPTLVAFQNTKTDADGDTPISWGKGKFF
jgi:hypothetical protein